MTRIQIKSWGEDGPAEATIEAKRKTCLVPDCDYTDNPNNKKKKLTRGLCPTHYVYVIKTLNTKDPEVDDMLVKRGVFLPRPEHKPWRGGKKASLKKFLESKSIIVDEIATGK